MTYLGGKNGAGVFQQVINQMPPHRIYVEPFLGSGAVFRLKALAELSVLIEASAASLETTIAAATAETGEAVPLVTPGDAVGAIAKVSGRARDSRGVSPAAAMPSRDPGSIAILGDSRRYLPRLGLNSDCLIYADPPYLGSTRARRYYKHEIFTDEEHTDLLRILKALPCMVILSGYPSELYSRELPGWRVHTFSTVNRAGEKVTECLWMNYPAPFLLHDYRYLGANFRERERIKRKTNRWVNRLNKMPALERASLFLALTAAIGGSDDARR